MRKQRKNLINKAPKAKSTVPMQEALQAREANLLGQNGILHGQDRYLAKARSGDLVIPINKLSPDVQVELETHLSSLKIQSAGRGGELSVSAQHTDGLGLAEHSDIPELLTLGAQMHSETAYRNIPFILSRFQAHIEMYLEDRNNYQIFIHKVSGRIQGALFAKATPYFFSESLLVSEDLFYVFPRDRSLKIARKLITAVEVWARTIGAAELCLSVSTQVEMARIGKFYTREHFVLVGGNYKKQL